MKVVKILVALLIVLLAGVVGVAFYGLSKLDELIEYAIEDAGSSITKTSVNVEGVEFKVSEGSGKLGRFTIANPQGFIDQPLLAVAETRLAVDINTLTKDVITIKEVVIDGAVLRAEAMNYTQTNLKALADNIKASIPAKTEPAAEAESGLPVKRLRIESFQFTNAVLDLASAEFGDKTLTIPAITASDVGGAEGQLPEQLAKTLLSKIINSARRTLEDAVKEKAQDKAEERLKEELQKRLKPEDQEKVDKLKSLFNR